MGKKLNRVSLVDVSEFIARQSEIATRLRELLKKRGYTQETIAEKLHLTYKQSCLLFESPARATFGELQLVLEELDTDLAQLMKELDSDASEPDKSQ